MRIRFFCLVVLVSAMAWAPRATQAQSERPIQISILDPVQIFPDDQSIKGLRLTLLYGRNADVKGVDLGWLVAHTTGDQKGLQWSLVGLTEGSFLGAQWGFFNYTKGGLTGIQWGGVNVTKGPTEAFQWGFVNVGEDVSGFQLGLVNYAERMYGLQIGLLNIIKSKEKLPVFPIVNWSF